MVNGANRPSARPAHDIERRNGSLPIGELSGSKIARRESFRMRAHLGGRFRVRSALATLTAWGKVLSGEQLTY